MNHAQRLRNILLVTLISAGCADSGDDERLAGIAAAKQAAAQQAAAQQAAAQQAAAQEAAAQEAAAEEAERPVDMPWVLWKQLIVDTHHSRRSLSNAEVRSFVIRIWADRSVDPERMRRIHDYIRKLAKQNGIALVQESGELTVAEWKELLEVRDSFTHTSDSFTHTGSSDRRTGYSDTRTGYSPGKPADLPQVLWDRMMSDVREGMQASGVSLSEAEIRTTVIGIWNSHKKNADAAERADTQQYVRELEQRR